MGLDKYHEKRDFGKTPEPRGRVGKKKAGRSFVIHKHAARNLHYDLRLEHNGVFLSWAVPKGPCLDPKEKHLAVFVEDHPLDYGGFEGIIPKGEYGGGTVLLWDRGSWAPVGDVDKSIERGDFKFELQGEKLRGRFVLVRLRKDDGQPDPKNWLLIKEKDEEIRELADGDVLVDEPLSVLTGRTIDEVARERDRVWSPGKGEVSARKSADHRKRRVVVAADDFPDVSELPGARARELDRSIRPQLATRSKEVPEGGRWIHEIKYDGYRSIVILKSGRATALTRNGHDWTNRFARVARAVEELGVDEAILDGEVAVLEPNGTTSFQALQNSLRDGRGPLVYFAFDLLHLNGFDLRRVPLLERKKVLSALLTASRVDDRILRYADHIEGVGSEVCKQASLYALEGIVSKRQDGLYRSGRGKDWLKIKFSQREDFVIGGFTDPATGSAGEGFGALLLGAHDPHGRLVYTGRVGTGFTESSLQSLRRRLDELERETPAFDNPPRGSITVRAVHWVEPVLVVQVEFIGWTNDDNLRHPSFQGIREDLPASDVRTLPDDYVSLPPSGDEVSTPSRSDQPSHKFAMKTGQASAIKLMDGLRLTHPDRVFYPERGITKIGLCSFYSEIVDWILPHVLDRPLSLVRCPEGVGKETFYQKQPNDSVPKVVGRTTVHEKKSGGEVAALYVKDLASLVGLVQIGVLEIHVWGSRIDDPERPDRMIFDLDPDLDLPWFRVTEAACIVRDALVELGLRSFVKTTGGKGLHVVVPIRRRHDWAEVLKFSQAVSEWIARAEPTRFVTVQSKARRKGKIYLDFRRNTRGATAIAPYSTRAHPQATVAVPLEWDELPTCIGADYYHVVNLQRRLSNLDEDPWKEIGKIAQSITVKATRRLSRPFRS